MFLDIVFAIILGINWILYLIIGLYLMSKIALIVDDSKTMREMVSFTMKSGGFDVLEAEDGVDALEVLKSGKVDLVVTDLNMPNMNGLELIGELRADPEYNTTPILMLTTESSNELREKGKEAGATGWIVKPFQPEKFLAIIGKVCP